MRPAALLHCPNCMAERTFVLWPGERDENMSECEVCGYFFGYIKAQPVTTVDPSDGTPRTDYVTRPVLEQDVLRAGIARLQAQTAERLKTAFGAHADRKRAAAHRHDAAQRMDDLERRARILGSRAPGLTGSGRGRGR